MRRSASLLAVVASAACFGTLAVLAELAYRSGARPLPLLAWRFALAAVLMGSLLAFRSPAALRVSGRDLIRFAVLATIGYGAASMCFFFALQRLPASVVAVLLYTFPAMVALASAGLLGERLGLSAIAGVAVTFAGCVLVLDPLSGEWRADGLGVLLGLGAAAGYAAFSVLSGRWLPGKSRLVMMTYMFATSAILVSFVALAAGESLSPEGWTLRLWALLLAIVAVPTFAAMLLYLGGIRGLGAQQAAVVSTFEPVFTIALAAALLGERLTKAQAVGAVLVLVGVLSAELGRRRVTEIPSV